MKSRLIIHMTVSEYSAMALRPTAMLADIARQFRSTITMRCHRRTANAKSVVSILALNPPPGAVIDIVAEGPDATEAMRAIDAFLAAVQGVGREIRSLSG
jgi:phosphotransferase system HPr (HPr) family protein